MLLEGSLQIGPAGAAFNVLPAGILEWTDTVGNVFATEGTLTNDGAMTLTGAASKRLEGTLINNGAIRDDGAGVLNIAGVTPGSTLLNNGLYELLSNAGIADGGTFVNAGILRKSGGLGSSAVTPFHFHNLGGHIEVTSGNMRLPFSGAVMAGGDFDVGSGASLDLPGGIYTGSFTGSGTGQVRMNQGARHTAGAGGAELNLDPGMLRMTSAALNGGPDGFTIAATSDLTATQGGGISFEGLVKNMGVIHHEAGPGGPLHVFGTLENHGVYLLDPGGWLSIPTTSNGTGTFANVAGGTLIKEPGPTEATIAGHFTNPGGDIIVEDGILTFFESVDNAGGDVIVEDGGTMRWAFGNYSQTSGTTTVLLGGTLTSPAVAILGGSLSGDGTINASGGVTNDGGVVAPDRAPAC